MKRTGGIVLAAGRSRRMGTPKALMLIGGRPALDAIVAAYEAANLDPIVVVASGPALAHARELPNVEVVEGDPDAPMIDSLARALESPSVDLPDSVVVQPVDAPFTQSEMIAALLAGGALAVRVLCHAGQPGHPVLVPRRLYEEIRARPEAGLRAVLAEHDVELVEWPDARVLADLDHPEDLARWGEDGRTLH